jgi:hypothetical protein
MLGPATLAGISIVLGTAASAEEVAYELRPEEASGLGARYAGARRFCDA